MIQGLIEKIKGDKEEVIEFDEKGEAVRFPLFRKLFLGMVIVLVALLAFGIGRLSVVGKREPVQIEYDPELANQTSVVNFAQTQTASVISATQSKVSVVASKNSDKYHFSHCAGAKQIKEENKIVFQTVENAEAAGYTLAANCSAR